MSKLFFVRHGESDANILNVLCGNLWDANLTERGINQVRKLSATLGSVKIDHIVTSPLKRAHASALIIQETLSHARLSINENLKEQSYGAWEGKLFEEIRNDFLNGVNPPNGESHKEFRGRLEVALKEISNLPGNTLIVAHGGVGSELMSLLGKEKTLIGNAELITLR